MRLALLSSYEKWHGGEVVFSSIAEGLAARGHAVSLVCRPSSALAERFGGGRLEVEASVPPGAGRGTAGDGHGVRVLTAPLRGEANPRSHVDAARLLRRAGAEVLLTNLSRDLKFGAPAARLLRIPHVHRFAQVARPLSLAGRKLAPAGGVTSPGRGKRVTRRLLRDWVSGCVTPSRFVRELLLARFPETRAVRVIHNGIDLERFRPDPQAGRRWRSSQGLRQDEVVVGCVGELERRRKAPQVLIEAVARSRAAPRLVFVGTGQDELWLRRYASDLKVNALFTGFQSDMAAAYNAFDLVAFPSRLESFGLAVAEAMACRRAVVAVNAGSMPELIQSGEEGRLVPPDEPGALAEAIDRLESDCRARERVGKKARARIESEFALERMIEGYEDALRAACEDRFGAAPGHGGEEGVSARRRRCGPSRRKRLGVALRQEPKRLLYPFLRAGERRFIEPEEVDLSQVRRVLLLRELHTIGDTLLATPAVRALRQSHPHLEIAMVAGWRNAGLWRENPRVSRLFVLGRGPKAIRFAKLVRDLRSWRPDISFTLESVKCHATLDVLARTVGAPVRVRYDGAAFGAPRTNSAYTCLVPLRSSRSDHQIDVCAGVLRAFGVELLDRRLELVPGPAAQQKAKDVLAGLGMETGAAFSVIHPGSKQVHNRWPLERFLAVYHHLRTRHSVRTLLSFGPSEQRARAWLLDHGADANDLLPALPVEELGALLSIARLLVCPDTGVLHVGAAIGVPIVGLYGSGDPRVWQPPGLIRAVSDHGSGKVRAIEVGRVLLEVDGALAESDSYSRRPPARPMSRTCP